MAQGFDVPDNIGYPEDEVVFDLMEGSEEVDGKRYSSDGAALVFTPERVQETCNSGSC